MSTIVLIRPGCTDFDDQQRIQGTLDLPLNARGEQQVQETLRELREVPLDVIYTSPSEPSRTTADLISTSLGLPVKVLEGLRNLHQGLWQGLHIEEIRRKHPKVFKQWQESPETICPPEGEMLADAVERVRDALQKPLKKKTNWAVVVPEPVATVVRCIVRGCKLEGIDPTACSDGERTRHWEFLQANGQAPGRWAAAATVSPVPRGTRTESAPVELSTRGGPADEFRREA